MPCQTRGGENLRRDLMIFGVHVGLLHVDRLKKAAKMDADRAGLRTRQIDRLLAAACEARERAGGATSLRSSLQFP